MVKWIVFYGDGSTFSNLDGEPYQAPRANVQILIQLDADNKWVFYEKRDHYVWGWRAPNEWVDVDYTGLQDYRWNHLDIMAELHGRWISNDDFDKIRKTADTFWRNNTLK